jgi:hypothetical protein
MTIGEESSTPQVWALQICGRIVGDSRGSAGHGNPSAAFLFTAGNS